MRMVGVSSVLLAGIFCGGVDAVIRGVNLGGWLVTEPWMTPSIFNATNTKDEWSLCAALGKDEALKTLQNHWSTYYTRDDFVQIKNAGLRSVIVSIILSLANRIAVCVYRPQIDPLLTLPAGVRIPFGYWAVDLLPYEPYVSGQYPYLIQAVQWAKDLGLTVFIDIHGAPGSQNGWEESGLLGPVAFLANSSNTDRTLNVLRNLTQEFTKPEYGNTVTNIELLNEPVLGYSDLLPFYTAAANIVGAGNSSGINTTISDGFFQPHTWENYNPWDKSAQSPAKYITIDTHQFWAFPPLTDLSKPEILAAICTFATTQLRAPANMGTPPTLVGEWSLSTGITMNSSSDTRSDIDKRTWFRQLFEAQNYAYSPNATGQASIGWYFWSWKSEYDIDAWSYRKGLDLQYIPKNISDPSTYAFPIANGCLDTTFNYTAPYIAAPAPSSSASPSPTTGTSPNLAVGSSSPSPTKGAASHVTGSLASGILSVLAACILHFA